MEALDWIDTQATSFGNTLIDWSNINSGSRNLPGLAKMLAVLECEFATLGGEARRIALPKLQEIDDYGNIIRSPLGDALSIRKRPDAAVRVLLNIHYDTVFGPADPFQHAQIEGDICRGPGVIDAKGGILVMLIALRSFERSPLASKIGWEVLLNSDEEIGSPGSASLLREAAERNHIGLLFEPAMRDGSLVGARKGSGTMTAIIHGRAAHAGRDFVAGRSAILAAADLIARADAIHTQVPGVIINCGKITGGGATNIVPDLAIARFNIRCDTPAQQAQLTDAFAAAVNEIAKREGITIDLQGGFTSPPKPLDTRSAKLMNQLIATGEELNLNLHHVPSGGASDGNKLAAAGLPVVDSLGPVGGDLHSDREFVYLPSIAERAKLVTLYLMNLAAENFRSRDRPIKSPAARCFAASAHTTHMRAAGVSRYQTMVAIRPVAAADLDGLFELARLAGVGLTTLPKDRDLLAKRIRKSIDSFKAATDKPGGESYLFVMEDTENARVVGACGITSKVGGFQPFYAYKIENALFASKEINVRKEVPVLRLDEEHDGPCEIGSLFLHPEYRKNGNGRMLQLVRFLFIAEHPERFESTVVSEIRGTLDAAGHSPFWDALGKHFFDIDFAEADRLSVVNKKFIADLMPRHPIYIPLLPADARAVIGKPHAESERAVKNLEAEGFKFANMVDIFDAGPVLSCPRDEIRSVRASGRSTIAAIVDREIESPKFLLGTTAENFRACCTHIEHRQDEGLTIPAAAARALQVNIGDAIRFVELDAS